MAAGPIGERSADAPPRGCLGQGDGLVVAGNFTAAGGIPANRLARWNGSEWNAFGDGVEGGDVRATASYNGDLYVGGSFSRVAGIDVRGIARWDGFTWSDLSGGIAGEGGWVRTLVVHDDLLYVGGSFTNAGGITTSNVAVWNGSDWNDTTEAVGNGVATPVYSLAARNDGHVFAGGGDFLLNGPVLMEWDGAAWERLPVGERGDNSVIARLFVYRNELYFSGVGQADGVRVDGLGRYDGTNWSKFTVPLRSGFSASAQSGAELYLGGTIDSVTAPRSDSNLAIKGLVKFDGAEWSVMGAGFSYEGQLLTTVRCLAVTEATLPRELGGVGPPEAGKILEVPADRRESAIREFGHGSLGGTITT